MDLIDRDALKDFLCTACANGVIDSSCDYSFDGCEIIEIINQQPEIESEPVRHGYWITIANGGIKNWKQKCSNCGVYTRGKSKYCKECGAKMDGGKASEID